MRHCHIHLNPKPSQHDFDKAVTTVVPYYGGSSAILTRIHTPTSLHTCNTCNTEAAERNSCKHKTMSSNLCAVTAAVAVAMLQDRLQI